MVDGPVDEKYEGVVENSEQLARLLLQLKPLGDVEEELVLWTPSPKCRCRSGFHYELYIRKTMEDRYEVRPTGFHVGLRSADHYPFDKALAKWCVSLRGFLTDAVVASSVGFRPTPNP